jgi:hypothetical protein
MLNTKWPEPYKHKDERDLDLMFDADIDFQQHERHLLKEVAEACGE